MAPLTQQKSGELLARPAQGTHRIETGAHQIAHRFVPGVRNPHRGQLAGPVQPGQAAGIAAIRLDPVACSLWDQRWGDHDALVPAGRQAPLNAIPARPRLVAKPQSHAVAAELAQQTVERRRRVGDAAILPNLAAQPAIGNRDDDAFLVNIKPCEHQAQRK